MCECECYRIDHPSADPECPAHGVVATEGRQALEDRIVELKDEVASLKAEVASLKVEKIPARVKRVYSNFDPMSEEYRLTHVLHYEGLSAAIDTAKRLKKLYLEASLKTRVKFHTRTYAYRFSYIEAAYSARHILRTKFLESYNVVI